MRIGINTDGAFFSLKEHYPEACLKALRMRGHKLVVVSRDDCLTLAPYELEYDQYVFATTESNVFEFLKLDVMVTDCKLDKEQCCRLGVPVIWVHSAWELFTIIQRQEAKWRDTYY